MLKLKESGKLRYLQHLFNKLYLIFPVVIYTISMTLQSLACTFESAIWFLLKYLCAARNNPLIPVLCIPFFSLHSP